MSDASQPVEATEPRRSAGSPSPGVESATWDVESRLRERVKELTALHRTSRILQDRDRPDRELMREIVDLLPGAWQYPEVAEARVEFRGETFETDGYRDTPWSQSTAFASPTGDGGSITVAYMEERPESDEGPFLTEERDLIDSLADMLQAHLENVVADEALQAAHDDLELQVRARTADLRRLASRLTLSEERERRRIASELHDLIGQSLALLKMRMREFKDNALFGSSDEAIDETLALLDQTIRYTRELTGEISPPVLYELGLDAALEWLAEYFTTKCRLRVRYRSTGHPIDLPEELSVMVYRSARELLRNSLEHSGSSEASLRATWGPDGLRLVVADKGRGFDPSTAGSDSGLGFGLVSIRERFHDLGGEVDIDSAPGEGCSVTLHVPRRVRT